MRVYQWTLALAALAFSASTAAAQFTFTSPDTPLRIPEGIGTSGTTISTINVPANGVIQDVNVVVDLDHTFSGDLHMNLTGPSGTDVRFVNANGPNLGGANYNGNYVFDDEATTVLSPGGDPIPEGEYLPANPLTAFDGQTSGGEWTLTIDDRFGGDIGTLRFWQLVMLLGDTSGSEVLASNQVVDRQVMENFLGTISQRLRRFHTQGGAPTSTSIVAADYSQLLSEDAIVRGQSPSYCGNCAHQWASWATGYGGEGDIDATATTPGLEYNFYGTSVGAERLMSSSVLVGFAGGWANSDLSNGLNTGSVNSNAYQAAVYGLYSNGCNYVTAIGSYAVNDIQTIRNTGAGTVFGDTDGQQFAAYLEVGARDLWRCIDVQPYASMQYINLRQNAFTETGLQGLNQTFTGDSTDSLRGSLGIRVAKNYCTRIGMIQPSVDARFQYEFLNTGQNTVIGLAGNPGVAPIALRGAELGQAFAVINAGNTIVLTSNLELYGGYMLETSQQHVSNAGIASLAFVY